MQQDTTNFANYRTQFSAYTLANLIDGREPVQEPYRSLIAEAYNKVANYFNDDAFRATLPTARKNSIEGQLANIIGQFSTLFSWQSDSSTNIRANIESIQSNISAYLDDFDLRFSVPHQPYQLQQGANVDQIIDGLNSRIETALKDAEDKQKKIEETSKSALKVLDDTRNLTGKAASYELADYYQSLANGRTVKENDDHDSRSKKSIPTKWLFIGSAPAVVFLYLIIDKIVFLVQSGKLSVGFITELSISLGIVALVLLTVIMINLINKMFPGGYSRSATLWMIGAIISTAGTAIYAAVLVLQMGNNAGWEEIVPKIIGLLAPAYFVRFCVQNFKANKHLAIQNTHRATVSKIVSPFTNLIRHENPEYEKDVLDAQINVINSAAQIVFAQSETGYLTTKEGAGSGSGDNMLDSLKTK